MATSKIYDGVGDRTRVGFMQIGRTTLQTHVQTHKYAIGQTVYYTSGMIGRANGSGSYRIVRHLPPDGGDYQYRIKSVGEAYERVAKESQLERDH